MAQNKLLLSRAQATVLARDFSMAVRLYRQLLRDDKDNISLLNQLGNLYMKSAQDEEALKVFKRISELDGTKTEPLITIGGIYRRLKRYEDSINVLEQALALDGTNPQISYNLGFTYKYMGDLENAISCFEDAIEMNPDDVLAHNHLGAIHASRGEHEKAIQSYRRGLNADANHPVLLLNAAKSYEALGEYEKACAAYSGALRSRPLWVEAIDGYARLLIGLRRINDAYKLVHSALNINPQDDNLKEALENVKKYMDEKSLLQANGEAKKDEKIDIPSLFTSLPKVDNEEFNSHGLEIPMDDDENIEEEENPEDEEGLELEDKESEEESKPFDFESMGMDDLAGDGPLDPLLFGSAGEEPFEEKDDNLDNLVKSDEIPFDSGETPDNSAEVFDGLDDEDFFETGNLGGSANPVSDGMNSLSEDGDEFADEDFLGKNLEDSLTEGKAKLSSAKKSTANPHDSFTPTYDNLSDLEDDLADIKDSQAFSKNDAVENVNMLAQKALDIALKASETANKLLDKEEVAENLAEPLATPMEEPVAEDENPVPETEVLAEDEGMEEPIAENLEESATDEQIEEEVPELEESAENQEEELSDEQNMFILPEENDDNVQTVETEDFEEKFGTEATEDKTPVAPELSLFLKLKELLDFLPEDKRLEFEGSRTRLMLDFIISKLSGRQGLFKKADELVESGSVAQWQGEQNPDKNIIMDGIGVIKSLSQFLPDEKLKHAIEEELSRFC